MNEASSIGASSPAGGVAANAAPRAAASPLAQFAWALFDGARSPYNVLVNIFVFSAYFSSVVIPDGVRGQTMWSFVTATGVIVEGGFTSIPDVFSSMKWGWLPLGPLITQRFDAASRLDKLKSPLLVVHGSDDSLIRPELGKALYERAREPKRFVLVEGGTHHNTNAVGQKQYRQAVNDLFGLKVAAQ